MSCTAGEGGKEEEKSSKGKPQAGAQRRVEAAFHCQTREDIAVEQKVWQELGLFYIVSAQPAPSPCLQGHPPWHSDSFSNSSHSLSQPEREGMFHRGPGLNLTSGQYTAPIAGYYAFTTTLHIGEPSDSSVALPGRSGLALIPCSVTVRREPRRKGQGCRGSRLRVLICVQSRCQQNRYGRAKPGTPGQGGRKESSIPGKGGACSPHHYPPSSAAIWRLYPGWRAAVTFSPSLSRAPFTCR